PRDARLLPLPQSRQILLDGDRRGGLIAHRRGDLAGELAAYVARGEQPRDRGHHALVGDEVAAGVVLRVPLHQARVGLEADEDENAPHRQRGSPPPPPPPPPPVPPPSNVRPPPRAPFFSVLLVPTPSAPWECRLPPPVAS